MAVEAKRGCGYRKAGGLYLVTSGLGEPCERLPILIGDCPCCKRPAVEQTRSFQWVDAQYILSFAKACAFRPQHCTHCVICQPVLLARDCEPADRFGLMWVGAEHYPTVESWYEEARRLGVSKRMATIPKELVLGKSFILVAHPKAITETVKVKEDGELVEHEEVRFRPGVFHAFRVQKVELVVTPSMKKQDWVKELVEKKGVVLVEVPEDDPDHAPKIAKKSARKRAMEKAARKMERAKEEVEG